MNTKLTLSLDNNVVEEAKKTAHKHKTSLSKMVENYLKLIIKTKNTPQNDDIKSLRGIYKAKNKKDDQQALVSALKKKYL